MIDRRLFGAASAAGLTAGLMSQGVTGGITRLMIGVQPGGGADVVARILAGQMTGYASPLVVESRPGAAERIALEVLKNSPADWSSFRTSTSI
jgi:tripartite-type tricarboxylate transporter receptor subunit TctC